MEQTHNHFELKLVNLDETGTFSGYGSVFDNVDSVGDIIEAGAFTKTLKQFKGGVKKLPILWQHSSAEPIGVYTEMREDESGLFVKGQINLEVQKGKEAYSLLKQGAISGLSIGYYASDYFIDKKGVRIIKEIKLFEISLVTFPANDLARVSDVKAEDVKTIRDLEKILRDAGYSRNESKQICSHFCSKQDEPRDAASDDLVKIEAAQQKLSELLTLTKISEICDVSR